MRVIIVGGGTGGHLYPGIAVAEELRARGGHELLFVGTARGIEARAVPKEGFALEVIDASGLKGSGAAGFLRGLARVPKAFAQSFAILSRFRPDLVVGVGGYASGPMVLAAALAGTPTAILEQNSVPGVTNRILGRVVRIVFAAFEESRRYFPAAKVRLAGNPIRAALRLALDGKPPDAATQQPRTLLVCGGSQGAHAVNLLVADAMERLAKSGRSTGPRIIHQTGTADQAAIAARYRAAAVDGEVHAFIDDMAAAYRRADLIVARAGATTLAELTAIGRAAILVPFPFAADDHQAKNAQALAAVGAATVMAQGSTDAGALAAEIARLLDDDRARGKMADASRALGRPDAAREIADALTLLAS